MNPVRQVVAGNNLLVADTPAGPLSIELGSPLPGRIDGRCRDLQHQAGQAVRHDRRHRHRPWRCDAQHRPDAAAGGYHHAELRSRRESRVVDRAVRSPEPSRAVRPRGTNGRPRRYLQRGTAPRASQRHHARLRPHVARARPDRAHRRLHRDARARRILARAPTRSPSRSAGHPYSATALQGTTPFEDLAVDLATPLVESTYTLDVVRPGYDVAGAHGRGRGQHARTRPESGAVGRIDRDRGRCGGRLRAVGRRGARAVRHARRFGARPDLAGRPAHRPQLPGRHRSTPTAATAPEPTSAPPTWWSPRGSPAASVPTTSSCPAHPVCTASSRRTPTTSPASVPTATPVRATSSCLRGSGCTRSRTPSRARSARMC